MMRWAVNFCRGYFQMCAVAAFVILVFFVLRQILRRFPKNMLCLLWLTVFFRLLCPVAVQGPLPDLWGWHAAQRERMEEGGSPADEQTPPGVGDLYTGLPQGTDGMWNFGGMQDKTGAAGLQETDAKAVDAAGKVDDADAGSAEPEKNTSGNPAAVRDAWQAAGEYFAGLRAADQAALVCGFAAMLGTVVFMILGVRRYAMLARLTKTAVRAEEGITENAPENTEDRAAGAKRRAGGRRIRILECAGIPAPMVFGILHPAVYLPMGFAEKVDVRERELILRHEEAHIKRGDHLLKILSWAVLGLHWWNPLVWICMVLFQKDMEMACDESVMAHTASDVRVEYAGALLHFSIQRSGLVFPAAFGESNTEKRVRNVLRYHKRPAAFTVLALCAAGALAVCLATNPHAVEGDPGSGDDLTANTGGGTDPAGTAGREPAAPAGTDGRKPTDPADTAGEEKTVFVSVEEMAQYYLAGWQEKASTEKDPVGTNTDSVNQVRYLGAEEREHPGRDGGRQIEMTFCMMDVHTGIPTVYKTRATCAERGGELHVEYVEEESFDHVDTAEQARRMGSFPFWEYFGQDVETGTNCAGMITERWMYSSDMRQFELQEPGSAMAMLLHLEGGSAAFQRDPGDGQQRGYVTYTFADGSAVTYPVSCRMARIRGKYWDMYWFPEGLMDEETAKEQVERAALAQQYIESATAQTLQDAVPFAQYTGSYEKLQEGFVLLDQAEGRDIALYGLLGGDAMVLRDKERCYPVYLYWASPQMQLPQIYAGDYDGDGQEEYALWTHMGTGTGVSFSELYMMEKTEEGISIREFDRDALKKQFEKVGYDWDSRQQMLYMKVNGERTGLSISLKELLEESDGEQLHFQGLDFHDIADFVERDGQWYYRTQSGIALEEWAILAYEYGVVAEAPVFYKDGAFSLGEITLKEYGERE